MLDGQSVVDRATFFFSLLDYMSLFPILVVYRNCSTHRGSRHVHLPRWLALAGVAL